MRAEYVERIVAENPMELLPSIRTMRAANPRYQHTEKHSRIMGGVIGLYVNAVPFLHVWRLRDHRFEKVFLGNLQSVCLHVAFGMGRDDVDQRDVEQIWWRWAATPPDTRQPGDRRGMLIAAVSKRLRRSHVRMLLCGFFPGLGALAGFLIRAHEAQRCHRIARKYFETGA